jgi:hypothetical protein
MNGRSVSVYKNQGGVDRKSQMVKITVATEIYAEKTKLRRRVTILINF